MRWLEQISRVVLSWGAQVVSNIISFLVEAVVAFVLVVPAVGLAVVVSQEIRGLYLLLHERSAAQGGWNPYLIHAMERLLGWNNHLLFDGSDRDRPLFLLSLFPFHWHALRLLRPPSPLN